MPVSLHQWSQLPSNIVFLKLRSVAGFRSSSVSMHCIFAFDSSYIVFSNDYPSKFILLDYEHFVFFFSSEKSMKIQTWHSLQCVMQCCDNHVTVHWIEIIIMAVAESGGKEENLYGVVEALIIDWFNEIRIKDHL